MPKGRFALLLQERQWPNAYIILTHAVAHVSGFDEFVAACEAGTSAFFASFVLQPTPRKCLSSGPPHSGRAARSVPCYAARSRSRAAVAPLPLNRAIHVPICCHSTAIVFAPRNKERWLPAVVARLTCSRGVPTRLRVLRSCSGGVTSSASPARRYKGTRTVLRSARRPSASKRLCASWFSRKSCRTTWR